MKITEIDVWNGNIEQRVYGELYPDCIEMRSISKDRIMLPYTGELPVECCGMNPRLLIVPKIVDRPSISLFVEDRMEGMDPNEPWKEDRFPIEATTEEIVALLSKFFQQRRKDGGLSTAAEVELHERFNSWRNLVMNAPHVLDIISQMPSDSIAYIAKKLQSRAE